MMRKLCVAVLAVAALGAQARAQTLTTMFRFDGTDGARIIWKPVADGLGNLYGTTATGGVAVPGSVSGGGTLYKFTPGVSRSFETLHSFAGDTDGLYPEGLTYDASSDMLYGVTGNGGNGAGCSYFGCGTIFSLNPTTGAYTMLYAFFGHRGANPQGALALGHDGALYGAARADIDGCSFSVECMLAYRFDPATRSLAILHEFSQSDGEAPAGSLVFGKDGKLFGLTQLGGTVANGGYGTVYQLDPVSGAVQVIYYFSEEEDNPNGLSVDEDDNLYVTTTYNSVGSIIKLTPGADGTYAASTLFSFRGSAQATGYIPSGALTFDRVRNVLYGGTIEGGAGGFGTLFQINPDGTGFTVLHSFSGGTDAGPPNDSILISLGELYGGTAGIHTNHITNLPPFCGAEGGEGCGTLFKYPRFGAGR